jgi:CHASE3 domain sensor protein
MANNKKYPINTKVKEAQEAMTDEQQAELELGKEIMSGVIADELSDFGDVMSDKMTETMVATDKKITIAMSEAVTKVEKKVQTIGYVAIATGIATLLLAGAVGYQIYKGAKANEEEQLGEMEI